MVNRYKLNIFVARERLALYDSLVSIQQSKIKEN